MQPAIIELKEIIYEITDNCDSDCSYCGSKETRHKTRIDDEKITKIVDNIFSYPPKEINISGGNPLLVDSEIHYHILDLCKKEEVVSKIILNPFNIVDKDYVLLKKYDVVGLSINTDDELKQAEVVISKLKKFTVITNFNIQNVFLYDNILDFCKRHNNLTWQIQYTMYKENNPLALYSNEEVKKYLFDKIKNTYYPPRVLADNMNNGECSAGRFSCGILADGSVIPCLSNRSWTNLYYNAGNLLKENFENIWIDYFSTYRCRENKCCKDICNAPYVSPPSTYNPDLGNFLKDFFEKPEPPTPNKIMLYGVQTYPIAMDNCSVYGVYEEEIYDDYA